MEVPGVAKMSPKEAINRVQLSRAADEKLFDFHKCGLGNKC